MKDFNKADEHVYVKDYGIIVLYSITSEADDVLSKKFRGLIWKI